MKLQLNVLNINDVKFAKRTETSDKVLYINRQELKDLWQQDKRLGRVDIELAQTAQQCDTRIYRLTNTPAGLFRKRRIAW